LIGSAGEVACDLALDEILLDRGEAVARVWTPARRGRLSACPCVSTRSQECVRQHAQAGEAALAAVLGVASKARDELRAEACEADGVEILRRQSGGAAVLVGPGVACFTIVFPYASCPAAGTIGGAYRLAASTVARALDAVGVPACACCRTHADRRVELQPPGDLACGGRKVAGMAQARRRLAAMVHGVIPVEIDPGDLDRYLAHPPDEPAYRAGRPHGGFVAAVSELADGCTTPRVLDALAEAFHLPRSSPSADELAEAGRLAARKYGTREWTFRR